MANVKKPPMENDLSITVEFGDITFIATKDVIHIQAGDQEIETTFDELNEVVDIVGASVLANDGDED